MGVRGAGAGGEGRGWDGAGVKAGLIPEVAGRVAGEAGEGLGAAEAWGVWGPGLGCVGTRLRHRGRGWDGDLGLGRGDLGQ